MGEVAEKYYSRRNLNFMLYEVMDVLSLTKHEYFSAHDKESMNMVIDAAESLASNILRPVYVETDRNPPDLLDGKVSVHPYAKKYYHSFCEAGLMSASFDEQFGGQQLPRIIYAAADFIIGNAHNGIEMFSSLSCNAARVLTSFASPRMINEFASKILQGESTATMCLTETGAGSSLSDITTEAVQDADGSYKIKGQKIFITAGDHDITENIMHLVLARLRGAVKGVKGISLFVVPKKRIVAGIMEDNDVASIGIYHKMGQRSTPAMHLEFGGQGHCKGWLIGEEGKGLNYMFQMMNSSRLSVGLAGSYIASAAYYTSLQYAKERPQGRKLNNKDLNEPQITIFHHPDVRRMLFLQKSIVEGTLALVLQCYRYKDEERICREEDKQRYEDLLELLTPVAKTCGAEMGLVSVNNGLQVLGGYGYTEDFTLEQMARDIRIMSLYEGTTGIQSLALLGRQIPLHKGRSLKYWKEEVFHNIDQAMASCQLQVYADNLVQEIEALDKMTKHLMLTGVEKGLEISLSDANLYMEYFGLINLGWQWIKQGTVAEKALSNGGLSSEEEKFYRSKIETMQFFFHYEFIKTRPLFTRLMDEKVLTVWKEGDALI